MTWIEQINQGLAAFGLQLPASVPIDEWAMKLTDDPCRNTAALVALSSLLFYAAEREHNPKVNDVFDAAVYCSTCLSVGYGDIFAKTPVGKLLGTVLMTIGPSLSSAALDGPADQRRDATQEQILATLKEILDRLPQNGVTLTADAMGPRTAD
jgi:hypothetical protein